MNESHDNDFESTLDFFILSGFRDGARSVLEIRQRIGWAERLLVVAAAKKGKPGLSSLSTTLERLQGEGWLKCEQSGRHPNAEVVYSLTDAGGQRLDHERARRHAIVSQFIEEPDLEGSFRRFLDQRSLHGPNWFTSDL